MKKGLVVVISAPSGAGKTTIRKKLLDTVSSMKHSISATTRKPRKGETDGIDYFFITEKAFKEKCSKNEFVEWACVHGNLYGTPKQFLEDSINNGIDIILDIDVVGALRVKEKYPGSVLIFVLPPSKEILESRLRSRNTDDEETIKQRLNNADIELRYMDKYDYYIKNINLDEAVKDVLSIIKSEKCKISRLKEP